MRAILILLALMPSPVAALELCEELWFTRNLLFHRAGYCFGSTLGQSIFGNAGCIGTDVQLAPAAGAMVARLREAEADFNCAVDTSATTLPIDNIALRKSMIDPPFPVEWESACVGYQGEEFPLRLGHDASAPITATVTPGPKVMLLWEFDDAGDWSYFGLFNNDTKVGEGWSNAVLGTDDCAVWAG